MEELKDHFEFGLNWADYAKSIDEEKITGARNGMEKLIRHDEMSGRSFLDIGCGSGIHSLAALRLGCKSVLAVDLDPNSVKTTEALLKGHQPDGQWRVENTSVFDLTPERYGTFDIVYSWGVLHHTGDMYRAIRAACRMVAPGGLLVIALYKKTPACGFWRIEKRIYAKSPHLIQKLIQALYLAIYFGLNRRDLIARWKVRKEPRGMAFFNDLHDWLGGYPYQSISPQETVSFIAGLGGTEVRSFLLPDSLGLLGSGCDEFVFRWPAAPSPSEESVPQA